MPAPKKPPHEFESDPIQEWEIKTVIKQSKISSKPSPFDNISYKILKKCPSLTQALLNLHNCCWPNREVPEAWKFAAIKLIGKDGAQSEPGAPSNF